MGALNVRNVPPELMRELKVEAAQEGVSLRELVLRVLQEHTRQKGATRK